MKKWKRIASLLLAAITAMGMSLSSMAKTQETGTLTIRNSVADKEYDLYRIFDLTYTESGQVAYTITDAWQNFFIQAEGDSVPAGAKYLADQNNDEKTLNPISVNGTIRYINIVGDKVDGEKEIPGNVAEFAQDALGYATTLGEGENEGETGADRTVTGTGSDLTVTNLSLGYYLVYPRGAGITKENSASICSLDSTTPDGSVQIKADYPTLTKQIESSSGTSSQSDETKNNSAAIGDTIHFKITTTIPDMTGYNWYKFVINDTLDAGLTFLQMDSIQIGQENVEESQYDLITEKQEDKTTDLKIVWKNFIQYQDKAGSTIVIRYSAQLNQQAQIGTGNKNSASLQYSSDPAYTKQYKKAESVGTGENPDDFSEDPKGESKEESGEEETQTFTTELTILKTDADGKILPGAQFTIESTALNQVGITVGSETSWEEAQTAQKVQAFVGEDGKVTFTGLNAGNYMIKETVTPDGYNTIEDIEVTIAFDSDQKVFTASANGDTQEEKLVTVTDNRLSMTVVNQSGSRLPSTGGIGTKLFYTFGSLLICGAFVALILRKRTDGEK